MSKSFYSFNLRQFGFFVVVFGAGLLNAGFAQDDNFPPLALRAAGHHRKVYPEPLNAAEFAVKAQPNALSPAATRRIGLHRPAPTSHKSNEGQGGGVKYIMAPALTLKENPNPKPGYPGWVHDVFEEEGTVYLTVLLTNTTPLLQETGKMAILSSDRGYALDGKNNRYGESGVDVLGWPWVHIIGACQEANTLETYGSVSSPMLSGYADEVVLRFRFPKEDVDDMIRAHNEKRLQFQYYYTYVGDTVYRGKMILTVDQEDVKKITNGLTKDQESGKAPLLLSEKVHLASKYQRLVKMTTTADTKEMYNLIKDHNLANQIFESAESRGLSFQQMCTQQPQAVAALMERLRPLVQKTIRANGGYQNHAVTNEKENTDSTEIGGKLSVPVFSLGGSHQSTERVLKALKDETGTTWHRVDETQNYQLEDVELFTLKEGWENVNVDMEKTVYVPLNQQLGYLEETPVPSWLTTSVLEKNLKPVQSSINFNGARIYSTVRFELEGGDRPGWKDITDGYTFPNDERVPKHLRGYAFDRDGVTNLALGLAPKKYSGMVLKAETVELANDPNDKKGEYGPLFFSTVNVPLKISGGTGHILGAIPGQSVRTHDTWIRQQSHVPLAGDQNVIGDMNLAGEATDGYKYWLRTKIWPFPTLSSSFSKQTLSKIKFEAQNGPQFGMRILLCVPPEELKKE